MSKTAKKLKATDSRYQHPVEAAPRLTLNDDGSLDEIVVSDVRTFHLEQMDTDAWWIGLTLADGRRIRVDLWSKAALCVRAEDD